MKHACNINFDKYFRQASLMALEEYQILLSVMHL